MLYGRFVNYNVGYYFSWLEQKMPGYVVLSGEKVMTTDLPASSSRVLAEHALPRVTTIFIETLILYMLDSQPVLVSQTRRKYTVYRR